MGLRPVEEVQAEVLAAVRKSEAEKVWFSEAAGRVLAAPVTAPHDVPHFANSAMDGFAVQAGDVGEPGAVLEIVADVPAGQVASEPVGPGQAIRIMTGAPMPEGADTVVRVEETSVEDGKVTISTSVETGNYVRPAGGDVRAGDVVFETGTRLTPMHLGVLAALGVVEPEVSIKPRVGVMSTGDEIVPPETAELEPGMIRDSNRPMLVAMLLETGVEVVDYGRIPDDPETLRAAIGRAAAETDVIVTSGGVSMGDYDVTKLVLRDEIGIDFMQMAMKPGKPFAFGTIGGALFFGLPGNPVSAMLSYETFARPALLAMQGARSIFRQRVLGVAGEDLEGDPAKDVFVRVQLTEELVATQTGDQASNRLAGAATADAFAVIPRGVASIAKGQPVTVELFRSPETREASRD